MRMSIAKSWRCFDSPVHTPTACFLCFCIKYVISSQTVVLKTYYYDHGEPMAYKTCLPWPVPRAAVAAACVFEHARCQRPRERGAGGPGGGPRRQRVETANRQLVFAEIDLSMDTHTLALPAR